MTTARNNMFHERGFMGGINAALEAFKWFDNDPEKIKDYLTDLKIKRPNGLLTLQRNHLIK